MVVLYLTKTLTNVTIRMRQDTAANWALVNSYILKLGELGLDTTNNIIKVGDGVHQWQDLTAKIAFINEISTTSGEGEEETTAIAQLGSIAAVQGLTAANQSAIEQQLAVAGVSMYINTSSN